MHKYVLQIIALCGIGLNITSCAMIQNENDFKNKANGQQLKFNLKQSNKPQSDYQIKFLDSINVELEHNTQINFIINKQNQQILAKNLVPIGGDDLLDIMLVTPDLKNYIPINPVIIRDFKGNEHFSIEFNAQNMQYIMWVRFKPQNEVDQYIRFDLLNNDTKYDLDNKTNKVYYSGSYKVNLIYDNKLKTLSPSTMIVAITQNSKHATRPVDNLENVNGNIAKISTFDCYGNLVDNKYNIKSVEAKKGIISFAITPKSAGYHKMFITFRINGIDYTSSFGMNVRS